jgi:plastocyanin
MQALLLLSMTLAPIDGEVAGAVTLANGKPAPNAVVYLEGAAKGTPMKKAVIDQRDRKFIPHVSVVTVGTRVHFPNNDVVFHNVFTEYHSERFDFGMYARGKTKSQVFDQPGLAVLLCSIHPEMSAYVMCVDTPFYAVADGKGRYRIPGVPTGEYTVRAWHKSGEKFSARQRVSPGEALNLRTER